MLPAGLVAAICLTAVVVAGVRITGELTRAPHPAELRQASVLEVARRWQTWSAGKIFPATVGYTLEEGGPETARLVGIGTAASCDTGLDPAAAGAVRPYGCRAVLRATYLDQSQGSAMTVGVAAFPDERSAAQAKNGLRSVKGPARLRALAFPDSAVARFADSAVQRSAAAAQSGPYVAFAVIGYADGRPPPPNRQGGLLPDVADDLAKAVLTPLATPARVDCVQPGWSC
ncbi:MAG: hypothetical protein JWL58_3575 [Streptosporangiaceae bacterium]|nr:hypothetical protein [Streptosporangiaceae bacterium]